MKGLIESLAEGEGTSHYEGKSTTLSSSSAPGSSWNLKDILHLWPQAFG